MKRYLTFISLALLSLLFVSCTNLKKDVVGVWESESKVIQFTEDSFVMINKGQTEVPAFKGEYSFAQSPENCIKLKYQYFLDGKNQWYSFEDSEYEGYIDYLLIEIKQDQMQTYNVALERFDTYRRVPQELLDQAQEEYQQTLSE